MFQWISIITICGTIGLVLLHAVIFPCGYGLRWSPMAWIRRGVHLFTLLFLEQHLTFIGRIRKLIYLLAMLSVVILAVTGFGPVVFGLRISGWLLMIHATFAGVFAFCMAFLAITWAQAFACKPKGGSEGKGCQMEIFLCKAGFWILILLSLPISLTMVLSMLRLFGTQGQEILLWIHRYCALVFLLIAVMQTYLVIRSLIRRDCQTV